MVLAVLALVAVVGLRGRAGRTWTGCADPGGSARGVLTAAGLLFFAFAGYARIATLGEEVRDPERTIPRAVPLALGVVLAIYLVLAVVALGVLGADRLAASAAPLVDVVTAAGLPGLAWAGPRRGHRRGRRGAAVPGRRGRPDHAGHGPPPRPARRAGRRAPACTRCRTGPSWRWPPW